MAKPEPAAPEVLATLLARIRACGVCAASLGHEPRPVLVADHRARVLVAGQAPGSRVHATGIPWNDASGRRLRQWLGLPPEVFYDPARVAIVPMGFCYPGRGPAGDLPPRPECRGLWHDALFQALPALELRIVIGQYAQAYHLPATRGKRLTDTVADWRRHAPAVYPLPHPSFRNTAWLARNPWFEAELLPDLRAALQRVLAGPA